MNSSIVVGVVRSRCGYFAACKQPAVVLITQISCQAAFRHIDLLANISKHHSSCPKAHPFSHMTFYKVTKPGFSFFYPLCYYTLLYGGLGALSYTAIRLSHGAAAIGYRHAGCLQLSHCRPPEMCGLQTGLDPPRVELPSLGGISSRHPQGNNLLYLKICRFIATCLPLTFVVFLVTCYVIGGTSLCERR